MLTSSPSYFFTNRAISLSSCSPCHASVMLTSSPSYFFTNRAISLSSCSLQLSWTNLLHPLSYEQYRLKNHDSAFTSGLGSVASNLAGVSVLIMFAIHSVFATVSRKAYDDVPPSEPRNLFVQAHKYVPDPAAGGGAYLGGDRYVGGRVDVFCDLVLGVCLGGGEEGFFAVLSAQDGIRNCNAGWYGIMGSWTAYLISVLYVDYHSQNEKEMSVSKTMLFS